MENHELAEINTSLQAIVRRAYDLGRTEALKRVVDVLSEDRPAADQLALMAPDKTNSHHNNYADDVNDRAGSSEKPWWAWPVR
jgi:ferritin-like metal-binding protein YciE